jgi:DMSO/TMAO reductase YedYZ molybdopterin-dependent catalytic subunit
MECSGNTHDARFGLMSAARWAGIPWRRLLERLVIDPAATHARIGGFDEWTETSERSTAGCSWVFPLELLDEAFLATEMDGEPLTADHGFPLRLMVPGWYGCCCPKWLDTIEFVDATAPATAQMVEFAERTHQEQAWELARDYAPATVDHAAMPIRVERWEVDGRRLYRIVGILWGGDVPTGELTIKIGSAVRNPVTMCEPPEDTRSWVLWSHLWEPKPGRSYTLRMGFADPAVRARRCDSGWYDRTVTIPED